MVDNIITFQCSFVIYPHLLISTSNFQKSFSTFSILGVNWTSLGFLRERFSKNIENTNHSLIIYHNYNIARLVNAEKCSFTIILPGGGGALECNLTGWCPFLRVSTTHSGKNCILLTYFGNFRLVRNDRKH